MEESCVCVACANEIPWSGHTFKAILIYTSHSSNPGSTKLLYSTQEYVKTTTFHNTD